MCAACSNARSSVSKAWKGEPGDKRNTKYALSAAGGTALAPGLGTAAGPVAYYYYRQSETGKRKRRESVARKKKPVSKSGALMPVKGIARAGGRFRRGAENAAVGAAGGVGRIWRYGRNNAMPLVIGGSIGAGGATAYQQTKSRRSDMSKSARDEYLVSRFGKGLPSALRSWARAGSKGMAPGGAYGAVRVGSNQVGRRGAQYATQNISRPLGPMDMRTYRGGGMRAASLGGAGKLGVQSGAKARGAAARQKRGVLVASRRPGQPGRPVLP